eukprot:SM000266S09835  [mRNA]  locus=s266:27234:33110:- [translate_table: standard]
MWPSLSLGGSGGADAAAADAANGAAAEADKKLIRELEAKAAAATKRAKELEKALFASAVAQGRVKELEEEAQRGQTAAARVRELEAELAAIKEEASGGAAAAAQPPPDGAEAAPQPVAAAQPVAAKARPKDVCEAARLYRLGLEEHDPGFLAALENQITTNNPMQDESTTTNIATSSPLQDQWAAVPVLDPQADTGAGGSSGVGTGIANPAINVALLETALAAADVATARAADLEARLLAVEGQAAAAEGSAGSSGTALAAAEARAGELEAALADCDAALGRQAAEAESAAAAAQAARLALEAKLTEEHGRRERLEATARDAEAMLAEARRELAGRVKHYESKLVTMNVINSTLQGEAAKLADKLKEAQEGTIAARAAAEAELTAAKAELAELQEEFTRRLGTAQKQATSFQQECFGLREAVETLKKKVEDADVQLGVRDAAAKLAQAEIEHAGKRAAEQEAAAKRARADAIRLEQERDKLAASFLEATAKSEAASKAMALDEARGRISELQQSLAEQREHFHQLLEEARAGHEREAEGVRAEVVGRAAAAAQAAAEREQLLSETVASLRGQVEQANQEASAREDRLLDEVRRLEQRRREIEMAHEDAASCIDEATRPLVRQMESMSSLMARRDAAMEERERELQQLSKRAEDAARTSSETQAKARAATEAAERRAAVAEKCAAEARAENLRKELMAALEQSRSLKTEKEEIEAALAKAQGACKEAKVALRVAQAEIQAEGEEQRRKLDEEKEAWEQGRVQQQHPQVEAANGEQQHWGDTATRSPGSHSGSPGDMGGGAAGGVLSRPLWGSSKYMANGSAVAMERTMAKVKQLQGEVRQLHRELASQQAARDHAEEELLKLTEALKAAEERAIMVPTMEKELTELRQRHDMALVIIGERNERADELEADMADVKALFREQVNLMINQVDPEKWPNGYRICLFCSHCAQSQRSRKRVSCAALLSSKKHQVVKQHGEHIEMRGQGTGSTAGAWQGLSTRVEYKVLGITPSRALHLN